MKYIFLMLTAGLILIGCERPTDLNDEDDGIPPGVPQGLRIYYAADGEIVIDWQLNPQPDVKGYNIYRRTENTNLSFIDFTSSEFYDDIYLDYDSIYFYAISAVDDAGLESSLTGEVSAKPENKFKPLIPSGIQINARNWLGRKSIFLKWNPNDEYDILGYKIFRSETSGFSPDSANLIGFSEGTEFEDTTATLLHKDFYYLLKAVDKGQLEGNPSVEKRDIILESPVLLVPGENSSVINLDQFKFVGAGAPAIYKIIVQSNQFFGELWSTDVYSELVNDTINVNVPAGVFSYNTEYYWRVAAFTGSELPNSFSHLNKFIIKPE